MSAITLPTLHDLIESQNPQNLNSCVIAFDPGETVGWALMNGSKLEACGEVKTQDFKLKSINALYDLMINQPPEKLPTYMVYESYRVYGWKADDHKWSELHTSQIIGILRYIAMVENLPYVDQSAQIAKQFVTDEKLKSWNMYQKGQRHARDAIRHAVYFQIFNKHDKLITGK